jgi:succinate-semialdehyde dehydrogenase/glutarate-semialdehyde dehydrogenase
MLSLQHPSLLRTHCYLNGAWVASTSGNTMPVHNPATGEKLADVPLCGAAETQQAIAAAEAALPAWRARTAAERGRILRRWAELMLAHQDDLALLMTSEQGKPLAEARGEITYAASFLDWFAEEGKRAYGEVIPHTRQLKPLSP